MKFELKHHYETDPETYWKVFFDEKYNEALYSQAIKVIERRLLELNEDDLSISRRVRITPDEKIPAALQKVIGGDTSFIEHSTWKKRSDAVLIRVELVAERLRPKFHFSGQMKVTPEGPHLRRDFTGEIKVDVMLLGGKIEKLIFDGIARNDSAGEPFMNRWLKNL